MKISGMVTCREPDFSAASIGPAGNASNYHIGHSSQGMLTALISKVCDVQAIFRHIGVTSLQSAARTGL
jgi:hypothetical protein